MRCEGPPTRRTAFVVPDQEATVRAAPKPAKNVIEAAATAQALRQALHLAGAFFGAYSLPHNLSLVNRSIRACVKASITIYIIIYE